MVNVWCGMNRLFVAFAVYAVLAALAWTTLSDPKFKFATLAILAMFAVRTWTWSKKQEREHREHQDDMSCEPRASSPESNREVDV